MQRVLSGIQPSGNLHIGNYFGMMQRMIKKQDESDLFCFIVNLHALTSVSDGKILAQNTLNAAASFLALGLDPEKATFWIQNDVQEHTELTWILHNQTPMGLLERCHAYKEKVAKGLPANHGLFAYPVLMAADILLYQTDIVPVGKDQKQHVEVARDIAGAFNYAYGETFKLPVEEISEDLGTLPGLDGQKMSKSYNNTIEIFSTKNELKKKVMAIVTSSKGVEEIKDPETCNLFAIYSLFVSPIEIEQLRARYLAPGLMFGEVKKDLVEIIWNYFGPARDKYNDLINNPQTIREIMRIGQKKASLIAQKTMAEVREKVGLNY